MSSSCSSPSSSPSSPMSFPCVISALGNPTVDSTKPEPVQPVTRTVNELGPDQVLVQIEYASINSMDPLLQSHNFLGYQLPLILGFDFSGHVVAVGSSDQSRAFHIGDPVFGFNFAPPAGGSCFATHVVVQNHTLCKNTVIPARDACTYGVAFVTAYESLVTSGNIGQYSGKTIFIPGGAGGVGHFAVQIARALGLHVISSASKASSLKLLHDLKCDYVIDYSKQDVIQAVNELTNGQGVDLVFDSTLQVKSYQQSMQVLKKGGVWIKLGPWEFMDPTQAQQLKQDLSSCDAQVIVGDMGRYSLVPSYIPLESRMVSQAFHAAIQWHQQGVVRPSIHSCIPFEAKSLQHALDTIKQGTSQGGKIIMQIQQQTQQTQTIAKSQ